MVQLNGLISIKVNALALWLYILHSWNTLRTTKKDTAVVWKTTTTTFMLSGTEVSSARQLKDKNEFVSF